MIWLDCSPDIEQSEEAMQDTVIRLVDEETEEETEEIEETEKKDSSSSTDSKRRAYCSLSSAKEKPPALNDRR